LTPESAQTEFTALATEVIRLLNENADSILKDHQPSFCGGCAGPSPKYVYKSPTAYRIGQLLETMRKRGHLDYNSISKK
jgi:hypothetical protein